MSFLGAAGILGSALILTILLGFAMLEPLRNWVSVHQDRTVRSLAMIGVLGSVLAIYFIFTVGEPFGPPGSKEYLIYRRFHRSMAIFLAFQTCAVLAFLSLVFEKLSPFSQRLAAVILAGWISMVIGTAAQYWLFLGLPIGKISMRSFSFSLAIMGPLLAQIAMLILGIRILRRRTGAWYIGLVLILYWPVDVALLFWGESSFLPSALAAAVMGGLVLLESRQSALMTSG